MLKSKYKKLLTQLEEFLSDDDCEEEVFQAGIKHLTTAVGAMRSMKRTRSSSDDEELLPTTSISPSRNSQCQSRFYSTKKKRE